MDNKIGFWIYTDSYLMESSVVFIDESMLVRCGPRYDLVTLFSYISNKCSSLTRTAKLLNFECAICFTNCVMWKRSVQVFRFKLGAFRNVRASWEQHFQQLALTTATSLNNALWVGVIAQKLQSLMCHNDHSLDARSPWVTLTRHITPDTLDNVILGFKT